MLSKCDKYNFRQQKIIKAKFISTNHYPKCQIVIAVKKKKKLIYKIPFYLLALISFVILAKLRKFFRQQLYFNQRVQRTLFLCRLTKIKKVCITLTKTNIHTI